MASTPLAQILRSHFDCDSEERIAALEAGAESIHLSSGEALFHQGDAGDAVYFLLAGRLRALTSGPDGSATLGEIARGETIGELAYFTGEPRSATVIALRDSTVARVPHALIERVISRSPELALGLTRLVIERYRQKETDRVRPAVPAIVCVMPISPGVDAAAFALALKAQQPPANGPIAVFDRAEIIARCGNDALRRAWWSKGPVGRLIDEAEQSNGAVYLAAEYEDADWTRFCLQHADEIVLLGDASASPDPSLAETTLLGSAEPVSIARRTLVLLHDERKKTPIRTRHWLAPRGQLRHFHIRPGLRADMARLARILSGRAVGLVFAGGGARGFAHIGVYQALEEAGVPIDFIGGTSIGALMGTMVALDADGDAIERNVYDAFLRYPKGNITGDFNLLPLLSLIKGERSRDSLATSVRAHLGTDIDMEDSWKTFFVIASNFSAGREEVLTDGPLVRNVSASFAIPGALPPVLKDGELLFDGGTFNNFPVNVMAEMGVGKVIGVDVSGEPDERLAIESLPGPFELLIDKFRPRARQRFRRLPTLPETMMMSSFVTAMSRQRDQRRYADLLFQPKLPRMGLLDWHRFSEVVEAGYMHAKDVLGRMGDEVLNDYK